MLILAYPFDWTTEDDMTWAEWFTREQRLPGIAALGIVVVASSLGNVLLKLGARIEAPDRLLFGLFAWQTALGIASFGCGAIFYAWALKSIDVHVAQSVIALQYIAIIFLAVLFLGERVPLQQWWGMGMIAFGLYLCSR
jgi:drug/metabolite transporter (DMT)-like permease